jgi:hypothetical protein
MKRHKGSCAAAMLLAFAAAAMASNPIQLENQKIGNTDWQLSNPAAAREIEGYASLTSVNRGGQIRLFVNTASPSYTLAIYRLGWYAGAGARLVLPPVVLGGTVQPMPLPDPATGLVECNWVNPYVVNVPGTSDPTDWASGIYLAKLTATNSGKQSYIIFVVREDSRASAYFYQSSVTTFQAYNNWGGKSLYDWNSVGGRAYKVSFNRPYALGNNPASASGLGAGDFLTTFQKSTETYPGAWEINMVRFLEREGYDVIYGTNLDVHANAAVLANHKALLSVGHDEYWSWEMRTNVTNALAAGVGLGFFSSNVCYWQIRMESSPVTGDSNRTEVCYKGTTADPQFGTLRNTNEWRIIGLPEDAFIGVQYVTDPVNSDIVISDPGSWALAGTGLHAGDRLIGLLGYEVDRSFGNSPAGTNMIANSPANSSTSNMTSYLASSGATVFATGSMQWNWGLDDFNAPALRPFVNSAAAQQITRNVLARFLTPLVSTSASVASRIVPSSSAPATPYGTGTLAAVTDGDRSGGVYVDLGTGPAWLTLDLGQTYSVNRVNLWHYFFDSRTYTAVIVQISPTADFSSGVRTVFNNDSGNTVGQGAGTDAPYSETAAGKSISFTPVNGRYVRLWSNGSSANASNHYVEVEVYGAGPAPSGAAVGAGNNLARGLTPVSSSSPSPYGTGTLASIADGDKTSSNYTDLGTGVVWTRLDLGQTYALNQVNLWHYFADGRSYHGVVVQVSTTPDFSSGVTTVFNNDAANAAGQGAGRDAEYAETASGKSISFGAVSARYVRVWSNGNTVNGGNHYVEVEVYAAASAPANIARGIPPRASGAPGPYGTGTLASITDGDKNSAAYTDLGTGTAWVSIDLGRNYSVSQVNLWHYYQDGRTYHGVIVQASTAADFSSGTVTLFNNDRTNAAGQGVGADAEYPETALGKAVQIAPVTARYIRLWSNGSTANASNHYVEVEVYGQ